MYNKDLCRKCGCGLIAKDSCKDCLEIILWVCKECDNKEEHIHNHILNNSNQLPNQKIPIEIKRESRPTKATKI